MKKPIPFWLTAISLAPARCAVMKMLMVINVNAVAHPLALMN